MNNYEWLESMQLFLGDCKKATAPTPPKGLKAICKAKVEEAKKSQQKDDDMYVSQDVTVSEKTEDTRRRQYFLSRLEEVYREKKAAARIKFGLDYDDPQTLNEAVALIKAGKFTIPEGKGDYKNWSPLSYLTWKDPTVKEDNKGYEAFKEKLSALRKTAEDAIWADATFTDAPKTVAKFESATVH
jgi:hypothetical protein